MPSQSGTSGELGLAGDTYDECVYREDTLVLLELTTRDMMEVNAPFWISITHLKLGASIALPTRAIPHRASRKPLSKHTFPPGMHALAFTHQRSRALIVARLCPCYK